MISRFFLLLGLTICCTTGCKKKAETETAQVENGENGTYFSIIQFAKDQVDTYWGQPFTLYQFTTQNGRTDSTVVSAFALDWAGIFSIFFKTDISDKKYLNKYSFSSFDDRVTVSRTYYYEAIDKDLYTKKLQIITDMFSSKIKSIYIETSEKGSFSEKTQKLYYVPIKLIQIQQFESAFIGKDKNLRTEYRFLY